VRACVFVKLYTYVCAQAMTVAVAAAAAAAAAALARVSIMHIERLYYMRARASARS